MKLEENQLKGGVADEAVDGEAVRSKVIVGHKGDEGLFAM